MGILRTRPSHEILSGESADVYFARAERILEREGLDPVVAMEVFARQPGILCGVDEAKNLLAHALGDTDPGDVRVEALDDGDAFEAKEVVVRIRARYRRFGLYETAILGMLAHVSPGAGVAITVKAFILTVLAGVGSIPGLIVAGIILGVGEAMTVTFVNASYRELFGFVLFLVILLVRPSGLFGRRI